MIPPVLIVGVGAEVWGGADVIAGMELVGGADEVVPAGLVLCEAQPIITDTIKISATKRITFFILQPPLECNNFVASIMITSNNLLL